MASVGLGLPSHKLNKMVIYRYSAQLEKLPSHFDIVYFLCPFTSNTSKTFTYLHAFTDFGV